MGTPPPRALFSPRLNLLLPSRVCSMPPVLRESSTGLTRQDSLPPTASQEAADAFEDLELSDDEPVRCSFIKPNDEQCRRIQRDGRERCWQHRRPGHP